jgi:hypothetical protein
MIKIEAVTTAITWNHNPIIDKYVINMESRFHPPFCIVATIDQEFIKKTNLDIEGNNNKNI